MDKFETNVLRREMFDMHKNGEFPFAEKLTIMKRVVEFVGIRDLKCYEFDILNFKEQNFLHFFREKRRNS